MMSLEKITDLTDSRLLPYRDIRNKHLFRTTGGFIAEGWRVVERLLHSSLAVHSILVSERREQTMGTLFADRAQVYIIPDELAEELVGYNFHAGVLAHAQKPENPDLWKFAGTADAAVPLLLCCPHLTGPDNLGSLIRLSAGFGATGILLGQGSVDPYLRRSVRVSMGTIFQLPIRTTPYLEEEIRFLKQEHGFQILAAEKSHRSRLLSEFSTLCDSQQPVLLMLGNEAEGLDDRWLDLTDQILHIPMATGVDSLNIANAAGIFLYELTRERASTPQNV